MYCLSVCFYLWKAVKNETCTLHQLYHLHAVLLSLISSRNVAMFCEPLEMEIKNLIFRQQGSGCILMLILLEVDTTVFTSLAISS